MKKTHGNKKMHFNVSLFCMCLLFLTPFLCTCGLDKYEYIEKPNQLLHRPYENSSFEDKYFEFQTVSSNNSMIIGTDVYYRIYNSLSKMNSDVGTVTNYIYSDDNQARAIEQLLSLKFSSLLYKNQDEIILDNETATHKVIIRLTDYQFEEDFEKKLIIDKETITNNPYMAYIIFDYGNNNLKYERPVRNNGVNNNLTFNFGRYSTEVKSKLPDKDDLDVCYSETISSDDENRWYVPMFAVTVAMDETYTFNRSVPLYLGYLIIRDDEYDN